MANELVKMAEDKIIAMDTFTIRLLGIILGMMPDMTYEVGKVQLAKDDWLITFTDGVTEAMTEDDEEFEEKRVIDFIKKNCKYKSPEEFNNLLIKDIEEFVGDAPQADDITLLTLKVSIKP